MVAKRLGKKADGEVKVAGRMELIFPTFLDIACAGTSSVKRTFPLRYFDLPKGGGYCGAENYKTR